MKDMVLTGSETTKVLNQCQTFYKKTCSGSSTSIVSTPATTPAPTAVPTPVSTSSSSLALETTTPGAGAPCYGDFSNLVVEEGNGVGGVITSSSSECQTACTNNANCQSVSFCPQWNGCWMKDMFLTGSETTKVLGQCRTYYKRTCSGSSTLALTSTPAPTTSTPASDPYCGIAVNAYERRTEVARLQAISPIVGGSFGAMCMGYGGTHPPAHLGKSTEDKDMCSLNINNDCDHWFQEISGNWKCARNYGISKNPAECHGRYFFLWDEPMTQGLNATWAADQWRRHVSRWGPEIEAMRKRGVRITTPLFTEHQGPAQAKFQAFFARCGPQCSDPTSNYYIDVLATNQWLVNSDRRRDEEEWIKNEVTQIRQSNGNRPVILSNFAWLGASTADEAVEAIVDSRIWDRSWSGAEAVFYFGATDYGGRTTNNFLYSQTSSGSTVGAALISRCQAYNR
jgi:hypothetical protein